MFLLIFLGVAPLSGLVVYQAVENRNEAVEGRIAQAEQLVRFASIYEEETISKTRQFLHILANTSQVLRGTEACNQFLNKILKNYPEYLNIGVARKDGEVICSAVPLGSPVNVADRIYFREAMEKSDFSIGNYQVGRISGKPSINFGYPLEGVDKRPAAVIFAALDISRVTMIEREIDRETPDNANYVKLDMDGAVLGAYPASYVFGQGSQIEKKLFETIRTQAKGVFSAIGVDGIERLYSFASLKSPLTKRNTSYIVLGIPKKALFEKTNRQLFRNIALVLIVTLLSLAGTWVLGERVISRPVNSIMDTTERISAGDLDARSRIPYGKGELGQLARSVDSMADSLQKNQIAAKNSREELEEIRARLEHVLASSPAIIYSCMILTQADRDTVYIPNFVSDKVTALFGYRPEEVLGNPDWWIENVHPDDRSSIRERFQRLYLEGRVTMEYRFCSKAGTYLWIRDEKVLVSDAEGAPAEIVGAWTDITGERQVEEQLRQAQKVEAVGRLAGGIAHDFNNLLTAIIGYCDLSLRQGADQDQVKGNILEIRRASESCASLTQRLLAFSRKQILLPRVLDLNSLVSNMEKMLRRLIGEDIDLVTLLRRDIAKVKVDPGQIEQVILNLAVNSRDAMPRGGKLTIETANVILDEAYCRKRVSVTPGAYSMFAMSDTGCGIDQETLSRIFEPFFTTKEKGTGLGLSTVYGIVKQSGGHIYVYSEPGVGTTFRIYFPCVEDAEAEVEEPSATLSPADLHGDETVLVVEDEDSVRNIIREILELHGYRVIDACNGEEAIRLCGERREEIHLLLTDVVMPGMSGKELSLKLTSMRSGLKVLFMSGYTSNAIVHQGVLQPGVSFLQKPFTIDSLARNVRVALDSDSHPQ